MFFLEYFEVFFVMRRLVAVTFLAFLLCDSAALSRNIICWPRVLLPAPGWRTCRPKEISFIYDSRLMLPDRTEKAETALSRMEQRFTEDVVLINWGGTR